jgi:uncharacterized protein (DUF427 family)
VKTPGPDHPITIARNPNRVRVRYAGHLIAETTGALELKEADYPPVLYIPRQDVDPEVLTRTERRTYCPYKGQACYFSLARGGVHSENAVWSYEAPYPAVAQIREYLAFYPDQVEIAQG